jgi:hypothetical protein
MHCLKGDCKPSELPDPLSRPRPLRRRARRQGAAYRRRSRTRRASEAGLNGGRHPSSASTTAPAVRRRGSGQERAAAWKLTVCDMLINDQVDTGPVVKEAAHVHHKIHRPQVARRPRVRCRGVWPQELDENARPLVYRSTYTDLYRFNLSGFGEVGCGMTRRKLSKSGQLIF